jgi:GNAT superfamily N-acetyltransferase
MTSVDVTVFYLEMGAPSKRIVPAPREDLEVVHAVAPTPRYYRFLYDSVGDDYHWYRCKQLSETALTKLIHDPLDEVHVLSVAGTPAGFAQLDRRQTNEIELIQFGLMPEFIGQRLGPWFLQQIIDIAWSHQPKRLWLHTCTLDHPSALPMYQQAGFELYREEKIRREIAGGVQPTSGD